MPLRAAVGSQAPPAPPARLAPLPSWGAAAATAAAGALGLRPDANPLHATLLRLWQGHLAPRSIGGYNSKLRLFLEFCDGEGLTAFPAAPSTMLLYVAWLFERGTISPDSFAQYVSVVNTAHQDMLLPKPVHPMLSSLIKAAQRARAAAAPGGVVQERRGPLPAEVVVRALARAVQPGADSRFAWATLAVAVAFHTGLRGASVLGLTANCFVLHADGLGYDVLVADEKGRAHTGRQRAIPCRTLYPELVLLLAAAQRCVRAAALPPGTPLFSQLGGRTDSAFGGLVQLVLDALRVSPPAGVKWLGHSCRSGMASACFALGVPVRPTLCERGGWHSDAVFQYIFSSVTADWFAFSFFGFLLPVGVRNATAAAFRAVPLAELL